MSLQSPPTSELKQTRDTRYKGDDVSSRCPKVGDHVFIRDWCNETRTPVARLGFVTAIDEPDNPASRISATILTTAAPTGTTAVHGVARGGEPDQWEFAG